MKIIYFLSPTFDYATVIYPGVGPHYARSFGWETAGLDRLSQTACDVGIIDNRLTTEDRATLDRELRDPNRRFPVLFKLTDPEAPTYTDPGTRYLFSQCDAPNIHYISVYDPEGPLRKFVLSLRSSRVFRLPFPYDAACEYQRDFADRRRRILLSGAQGRDYYPLRHRLRRRRRFDPLARLAVSELPHPGYADIGQTLRHNLIFDRFIAHAAGFTHLFLCPTRYRVELMKYVECAYAGCVPIGQLPRSLEAELADTLISWSGTTRELVGELWADRSVMADRAARYRAVMRRLRDPAELLRSFESALRAQI